MNPLALFASLCAFAPLAMFGQLGLFVWYAPQRLPAVLLALITFAIAIFSLYPQQLSSVPKRWRWILPCLRGGMLLTVAIALMRPAIVRPTSLAERGAVIVLVDASRSCGVVDTGRSAAGLLGLAQAMGRISHDAIVKVPPPPAIDLHPVYDAMDDVIRGREGVDYAEVSGRDPEAARAHLDDAMDRYLRASRGLYRSLPLSRPASLADAIANLANISADAGSDAWARETHARIRKINETLAALQQSAEERLFQSDPNVREMCQAIARHTRAGIAELVLTEPQFGFLDRLPRDVDVIGYSFSDHIEPLELRRQGSPVHHLNLDPSGSASDLTGALSAALAATRGRKIQAVVLFSDGRQVGGDTPLQTSLRAAGAPVFTVPLAARSLGRDATISRVQFPETAFLGDSITVHADVRATGIRGPITVHLLGAPQPQSTTLNFETDQTQACAFTFKPQAPGVLDFSVQLDDPGGDMNASNNQVTRSIKVLSDKVHMLAVAADPSWDFRYLRAALSRAPGIDLTVKSISADAPRLDSTPEDLAKQDVIFLYDVPPSAISAGQWKSLHEVIADRGGAVFLMAGAAHLPVEYLQSPASDFLPFAAAPPGWKFWPGENAAYFIEPAAEAKSLDFLQLRDTGRWPALPAMFRYFDPGPLKPIARPLLVDRDSQTPVLIETRLGRGRTFFVGIDETWRWRYKEGSRDQDRLWLQLARYASEQPYAIARNGLGLDADRVRVDHGTPIRIRVRNVDPQDHPRETSPLLALYKNDSQVAAPDLAPAAPENSGRFETTLRDLPAGDYTLRLTSGDETLTLPLKVEQTTEAEMADLTGDERMLHRIAEGTGGQFIPLDQVGTLPDRIAAGSEQRWGTKETPLWDGPYLYAVVLAALAAEWAMRKHFGLV